MNTNLSKYLFLINILKQNPNKIFTPYDTDIIDGLGLQTKQIGRMFDTLEQELEDITRKKRGKKRGFCFNSKTNLLKTSLDYQGEISAIIQTIKDYDEDIVRSLEQDTISSFDIYQIVDRSQLATNTIATDTEFMNIDPLLGR